MPKRDLFLLPALMGVTVLVLFAAAEMGTRALWPEQFVNSCRMADPSLEYRYRPNCSTSMKVVEGPWVTETFNECGYRSATPCAAVPANEPRVALLGASVAEGYMVEFPATIGARLATDLSAECHAAVDVQNLGAIGYFGHRLVLRMAEAAKLHPDAAVLIVSPFDLEGLTDADLHEASPTVPAAAPAPQGLLKRVFESVKQSRAFVVAEHFMFRNPSIYVPLYLSYGDKADFLRQPFTLAWQQRLARLDTLIGQIEAEANAAETKLVIAFVPQEAEVALMAGRYASPNVNVEALPDAIAAVARNNNAVFVDTSIALRAEPKPEQLYYQVDGHLSGEGQPIVAAFIARSMAAALGRKFPSCSHSAT